MVFSYITSLPVFYTWKPLKYEKERIADATIEDEDDHASILVSTCACISYIATEILYAGDIKEYICISQYYAIYSKGG